MSVVARWHEEKQSAWIYRVLTQVEKDPVRAAMFEQLSGAAEAQASILLGDLKVHGQAAPPFTPSLRAILVVAIVRRIGVQHAKPLLAALKVRGLSAYSKSLAQGHVMPVSATGIGERHRRGGKGGTLRAAVFGVNDGLVSNTSLILGLAGAVSAQSGSHAIILASGVAGLLAGAFSMAAGEYVSMRSQRELFEFQIGEEREELERYPDEEAEELALIYAARGVPIEEARKMTREMIKDPVRALDTLAREELGLNPDDLGSPWGASVSSFLAFAAGAFVPLVPFLITRIAHPVEIACGLAAFGLLGVGAAMSLFSGKNAVLGGLRMLVIGALAGGATFGIGRMLGVATS